MNLKFKMNNHRFENSECFRAYQKDVAVYQAVDELIKAGKLFKAIEDKTNSFVATYKQNRNSEHLLSPFLFVHSLINDDFRGRSPLLLILLTQETDNFSNVVRQRTHCVINTLLKGLGLSIKISLEQVHVKLRILELPQLCCAFDPSENLLRRGLSVFHCILTGFSVPEKYLLQSTWYCASRCSGNIITGEVSYPPLCNNCRHPMNEYTKLRAVGDYRLLKVLPARSVQTPKIIGKVYRGIIIRLEDDLAELPLALGEEYIIVGVYNCQIKQLLAWKSVSANMCCNLDSKELDEILQLDGPILYDGSTNSNAIQILDSLKTTSQTEHLQCDLPNNALNCSQNIFTDNSSQPLYSLPLRQETDLGHSILLYSSTFQQTAEQEMSPFIIGIKEEATVPIPTYLQNIEKEQSLPLKSIAFTLKKDATEDEQDFTLYPHRDISLSATPFVKHLEIHSQHGDIMPEALYRDLSLIPRSIVELHEIICGRFSDFAFVYTLSAQMCKDLAPMHSFVTLKMGLLLSIASIGNNENVPPLPILAVGPDNSSMNLIMNSIGNAAQRFITTLDDFQCGSIVNDNFIEAGPILLAKGGVCYLGDWSRLKNLNNNKILKDIERGSMIIEKTEVCYPIKSAIWTFVTLYNSNKKDFITFNTLFELFGIPLMVEDTCDESLSDILLAQSCGSTVISQANEFYVPLDDIKTYLELVSKRKLDISGHANEILQKYFIAVRVDRPDCLPQRAFAALSQMSESFAKLAFRHVVLPIDVVSAIYLAEHFIKNSFGPGMCPSPTLAPKKFVGDVDAFIKEFEIWLDNYMARYADT